MWVVRRAESYHGDRLRGGLYARGWLLRPLHLVRLPLVLCFRVRLGDQYVGQEGKQTQSRVVGLKIYNNARLTESRIPRVSIPTVVNILLLIVIVTEQILYTSEINVFLRNL